MLKIFINKNIDYGASYNVDKIVGVVIRLGDTLQRLKTITRAGHQITVKEEKLRDTLMDIANYSAIALMFMHKENDKKKSSHSNHKQKLVQQGKDCHRKSARTYRTGIIAWWKRILISIWRCW